jgi:hypothetical protein
VNNIWVRLTPAQFDTVVACVFKAQSAAWARAYELLSRVRAILEQARERANKPQSLGDQKLIACAKLAHAYQYLDAKRGSSYERWYWPRNEASMLIINNFYQLAKMPMNDFFKAGEYDLEDSDV